jgi:hypothetical protein
LRLGVADVEPRNNVGARVSIEEERKELLQAVKTLLDVRDRMHQTETKGRLQ